MRQSSIVCAGVALAAAFGCGPRHEEAALVASGHIEATEVRVAADAAERERLQSTGIGDGVAIPHTSVEAATRRAAALVLSPQGVPFDAIDGANVHIVLGVVGPKDATGEHLRVLARISRLLRDEATRRSLANAPTPGDAFAIIESREQQLG